MARLLTLLLVLLFFGVRTESLHAKVPIVKTYDRFKKNCDDGEGMACYSYGRALWNMGQKREAVHYFARGCDLKYKLACDSYKDHSTIVHMRKKRSKTDDGRGSICFTQNEFSNAKFSANPESAAGVKGQKISNIKPNSFWAKAGLQDGDIVVRMNNMLFASHQDIVHAFAVSGKTFGFEVMRNGDTITLWYTCQ